MNKTNYHYCKKCGLFNEEKGCMDCDNEKIKKNLIKYLKGKFIKY